MFLDSFVKNYTNNNEFCGSLLTSLCKSCVLKVDGVPNPQYGTDVLKIFLALSEGGDKRHLILFQATSVECHCVG